MKTLQRKGKSFAVKSLLMTAFLAVFSSGFVKPVTPTVIDNKMNSILVEQLWPYYNEMDEMGNHQYRIKKDAFEKIVNLFEEQREESFRMYCGAFLNNLKNIFYTKKYNNEDLKFFVEAFNKCTNEELNTSHIKGLVQAKKDIEKAYNQSKGLFERVGNYFFSPKKTSEQVPVTGDVDSTIQSRIDERNNQQSETDERLREEAFVLMGYEEIESNAGNNQQSNENVERQEEALVLEEIESNVGNNQQSNENVEQRKIGTTGTVIVSGLKFIRNHKGKVVTVGVLVCDVAAFGIGTYYYWNYMTINNFWKVFGAGKSALSKICFIFSPIVTAITRNLPFANQTVPANQSPICPKEDFFSNQSFPGQEGLPFDKNLSQKGLPNLKDDCGYTCQLKRGLNQLKELNYRLYK